MAQDYTPKYISLDEIPVQIPDDFSDTEKRDALEFAEAIVEFDLNDGVTIPDADFTPLYEAALKQKATCELAKGSEHPDDISLGDLADGGDTKVDYANEAFCDRYQELVDKIVAVEETVEDPTGNSQAVEYVYSTSAPDAGWKEDSRYNGL